MKNLGLVLLLVALLIAVIVFFSGTDMAEAPTDSEVSEELVIETNEEIDPVITAHIESKRDLIQLTTPTVGGEINSPLNINGQARGYWFFEASFPVILTNWDGLIIAEGIATAKGEWMTEEFVPFSAQLEFVSPYKAGDPDFMQRGSLILQKDNPSGLPEHDDALEMPITFTEL